MASMHRSDTFKTLFMKLSRNRGALFGILIITALIAFEIFNYSTTEFALHDLLGDLRFIGIRWATILAIAFCGIDFAGIARLFTPEQGADEPMEVWYLLGAWLLGATMNAILTWWGVSIAIYNHQSLGTAVIDRATLLKTVPVFVAVMVWLSRVLIIGTFSVAGERLFSQPGARARSATYNRRPATSAPRPTTARPSTAQPRPSYAGSFRPAPRTAYPQRPEPTYEPVSARPANNPNNTSQSNSGYQ